MGVLDDFHHFVVVHLGWVCRGARGVCRGGEMDMVRLMGGGERG